MTERKSKTNEPHAMSAHATYDVDHKTAERVYSRWLDDTSEIWSASRHRPRQPLWDALDRAFTEHYCKEAAQARTFLFSLLLEVRAHEEERNSKNSPP